MAVFGPNQKEELIIGEALAGETKVSTFISGADNKEIGVYSKNGGAVAANQRFYVLQKTDGSASKGLNYEFSNGINPSGITKVSAHTYVAPTEKKVRVNGFTGTVKANSTYEVFIRILEDSGTMSVENFRHIIGSYTTTDSGDTNTTVIAGIVKHLKLTLRNEDEGMFTITAGSSFIDIEANPNIGNASQDVGAALQFEVEATVKSVGNNPLTSLPTTYNILTADVTRKQSPGTGAGKYVNNLEWFTRGYNYEVYRGVNAPANFNQPDLYSDRNGKYGIIHINYEYKHNLVSGESQPAVLTIAVATDTLAENAVVNAILAKIRIAAPNADIDANLPVA